MNTTDRKEILNAFLLAVGYGIVFYAIQFFMQRACMVTAIPERGTLGQWDANIYEGLSKTGYEHFDKRDNTGWYILLPWVWKVLHVGMVGMSFANLVFFSAGFAIIAHLYHADTKEKFLWLSTPSLFFMFVPYTEALFCFLAALSFYGIVKQKRRLIWCSLFLLSLTRFTAIFFIPVLLLMELLTNAQKDIWKVLRKYLVDYALPVLAGFFAFALIQYQQIGIWFAYYKQQSTAMGHELSLPVLPFSNFFAGPRLIWLSALAMFAGVIAFGGIIIKCYRWLVKKEVYEDKIFILALGYLPIILMTMVFCNPKWGSNTTNLIGLHRYTFCSPFVFVFLYYYAGNVYRYKTLHFIFVLLFSNLLWLSMGSYLHIQEVLFYNMDTLLILGYMLHANKRKEWATYGIIAINIFLQVSLYQQYLNGLFPD